MRHKEDISIEWKQKSFMECLVPVSFDRLKQVQANSYLIEGNCPVVDQGQNLIAGWTNDGAKIIKENLPLIIFGDHTRIFKYVDFPFALGADGTKPIKPKQDEFSTRFFYYYLLTLNIPERGYNRHYKLLKEQIIHYPSLAEQQQIAAVLFKIQQAIEIQESIIEKMRELKKSTLHHVFTHGLRGETSKETEIGPIPESWEVPKLDSVLKLAQYGLSVRGLSNGQYPILRMNCQVDGQVHLNDLQYVNLDSETFGKFKMDDGDILFNRTNSWELVGRTAIYHSTETAVFASYLIRLKLDEEKITPDYLNYFFNMDATQKRLKSLASRGVSQSNISASKLKTFQVPVPAMNEQLEIVKILRAIHQKIFIHITKKSTLQDLFKTILNKLMTGEVRVKDLDIDISEVSA
jgi:type I restriction enzyme S subunit